MGRWRRRRDDPFNRDHLLIVEDSNGKVLRRILIEEGNARQMHSAAEQHEAMIRASERDLKLLGARDKGRSKEKRKSKPKRPVPKEPRR